VHTTIEGFVCLQVKLNKSVTRPRRSAVNPMGVRAPISPSPVPLGPSQVLPTSVRTWKILHVLTFISHNIFQSLCHSHYRCLRQFITPRIINQGRAPLLMSPKFQVTPPLNCSRRATGRIRSRLPAAKRRHEVCLGCGNIV